MHADTSPPSPVEPGRRIEAVDMVRGFALFGVLLVNMYNFGAGWPIWTGPADRIAAGVMRFFFETKSWRLFSFLFGLGFAFQLLSARRRELPLLGRYLRRLGSLFVIGALHALLYDGDILMLYAELGLLLVLFVRVPPRVLLVLAIGLLAVFPVGNAVQSFGGGRGPADAEEQVDWLARRAELMSEHPYSVGSVREVMAVNAQAIPPVLLDDPLGPESNLGFFAMFLLGLYAGLRGIFRDLEGNLTLIRRVRTWGLGLGFLGMGVERSLAAGWGYDLFGARGAHPGVELLGDAAFAYGSTALSLGYAAAVLLLARSPRWRRLVAPLGPVGRMALTVYLSQSLVFTTLFYGYGFGLALQVGPLAVSVMAVVIFVVQIVACGWWLERYRFGPAEWAWRAVTYLRAPPMRLVPDRA